jgi:hypothetical protein
MMEKMAVTIGLFGLNTRRKSVRNYIDKPSRKGKLSNRATKSGSLTKYGLVYKNDLLDVDYTSQRGPVNKTRGV